MAKQDQIRSKLASKIFTPYGKSVTLISKSSPTYNIRGELEAEATVSSSIKIVPYNIIAPNQTYQDFGTLEEGESDAAISYDTVVAIDDEIEMEGESYYIKDIQPNYLPDNVVTVVRLSKKQP